MPSRGASPRTFDARRPTPRRRNPVRSSTAPTSTASAFHESLHCCRGGFATGVARETTGFAVATAGVPAGTAGFVLEKTGVGLDAGGIDHDTVGSTPETAGANAGAGGIHEHPVGLAPGFHGGIGSSGRFDGPSGAPMMQGEQRERLVAFTVKLQDYREKEQLTQDEMSTILGISRKTYIFFEQARWTPSEREDHHMVHTLYKLDPALAEAYAAVGPATLEDFGIVRQPPAPAAGPPLPAKDARRAYDAALYRAAEEHDMAAKSLRPIVAAILAELQDAGMTLDQAVDVAKSASASRGKP